MTTTARPRRAAGRPPKIAGGSARWWLYVNPDRRAAAEERARRENPNLRDPLPDVLRAFLDAYAAGTVPAPTPPEES